MNNIKNFRTDEIQQQVNKLAQLVDENKLNQAICEYENLLYEVDNYEQNMHITRELIDKMEPYGQYLVEIYVNISLYLKKYAPSVASDFMQLALLQNKQTPCNKYDLTRTILIESNLIQEAIDLMQEHEITKVSDVRLYSELLFQNKQYEAAINSYLKLLEIDNKLSMHETYAQIGRAYMQLFDYAKAEEAFLKANIVNDIDLLLEISQDYEQRKEYDLALKHYLTIYNLDEPAILEKIEKLYEILN